MKKLIIGFLIGAASATVVFYFINKSNRDEERENVNAFLASLKEAKASNEQASETLNKPGNTLFIPSALTLILNADGDIFYYGGDDCSKMGRSDMLTVNDVLTKEKARKKADDLMIIIKNMPGVPFRNSVDLLDAIRTAGIPAGHFAEVELTEAEKNCIQNYKKN